MYQGMTYEMILQRMLDRVPNNVDKREGSVIWDALAPEAAEIKQVYIEFDDIMDESFADTASREFLTRRAAERGIIPFPATHAVLQAEFAPETIDMTGRRFNMPNTAIAYTVRDATSPGVYRVQCETAGDEGNLHLGAITPIDYVQGLQTAKLTGVLVPGQDEEDTEVFRRRYLASFTEKAFGGNTQDYLNKANSIEGVGATKVTPVFEGGYKPSDLSPPDGVEPWIDGLAGRGDILGWLRRVYDMISLGVVTVGGGTVRLTVIDALFNAASGALLDSVQTEFDPEQNKGEGMGLAPVGHAVTVDTATEVAVSIRTSVTLGGGYSWASVEPQVVGNLQAYFLGLRKSWADEGHLTVRISNVDTNILSVQGVVDVQGTTLNGAGQNLPLGAYEIPVLGGVNEWQGK